MRGVRLELSTPALSIACDIAAEFPEFVERAVDDLTHELKSRLLERYGLDAEVRSSLMRKLWRAAESIPSHEERHAVWHFLTTVDHPAEQRKAR